MNNVIIVRVNGIMKYEYQRKYREELLKDIKEGLFIIDDSIKEVQLVNIDELGIEGE